MKHYKTKSLYGYSILGERPPKLDSDTEYVIIAESSFFPKCVIIQRTDNKEYFGEKTWIVPRISMY